MEWWLPALIVLLILGRVMRQRNGRAVRNLVIVTAGACMFGAPAAASRIAEA